MLESYLSSFLITIIQATGAAFLCFFVVHDTLNKSRMVIALQTLGFVIAYSCLFSVFVNVLGEVYFLPLYGLCLVCGWWYLRRVTDEKPIWLFFLACMTFSFISLSSSFTYVIYAIWIPENYTEAYFYEDILAFAIPPLLFLYPFAWIMRRLHIKLRALSIANMWLICSIPVLFSVCILLQNLFLSGETIGVIESCIIKAFIIFCAFLTYSQMISALNNAEKAVREQENRKFLAHQFDLQKMRMEDLEAHAEEMRRIRHDRRQHVEVLKGLLSHGKLEEAREYLKDYEDSISKNIQPSLCDNFAADTICQRYQTLAKQASIKTVVSLTLSKNPGISGSDLAVILGNLWENAIAATLDCNSDRFIRLKTIEKDGKVFIRMENSFENIAVQDDGQYLSTKAGRDYNEGIGLSSIKAAASKYGGVAQFTHEHNIFTASILLHRSDK